MSMQHGSQAFSMMGKRVYNKTVKQLPKHPLGKLGQLQQQVLLMLSKCPPATQFAACGHTLSHGVVCGACPVCVQAVKHI